MTRKAISFRLRKIDADLAQALEGVSTDQISDLCRDGLRWALGMKMTKRIEVTEHPLTASPNTQSTSLNLRHVASKPAMFVPQRKR